MLLNLHLKNILCKRRAYTWNLVMFFVKNLFHVVGSRYCNLVGGFQLIIKTANIIMLTIKVLNTENLIPQEQTWTAMSICKSWLYLNMILFKLVRGGHRSRCLIPDIMLCFRTVRKIGSQGELTQTMWIWTVTSRNWIE